MLNITSITFKTGVVSNYVIYFKNATKMALSQDPTEKHVGEVGIQNK